MKTKIILGIIFLLILNYAVLMKPDKGMHVQKISNLIEKPFKNTNLDSKVKLMEDLMFERFIELEVDYYDYWFYSIGYYSDRLESEIQSFGIYGEVFVISN